MELPWTRTEIQEKFCAFFWGGGARLLVEHSRNALRMVLLMIRYEMLPCADPDRGPSIVPPVRLSILSMIARHCAGEGPATVYVQRRMGMDEWAIRNGGRFPNVNGRVGVSRRAGT